MEKIITAENLRRFAYVNDGVCKRPVKGIVLSFFGLGGALMYNEDISEGRFFGDLGILYVVPYNNPWAWMNPQAVRYTDEIVDVLFKKFSLPEELPVVSTGLSMGGLAALVYTRYAKRTPVACVANCPVCDLVFHFTERPDLPRTIYSAFFNEEGSLEEVLKKASPLHLAAEMPDADYHIFHCAADQAVNMARHSDRLVEALRAQGRRITYDIEPGRGHCDLTPENAMRFAHYCVEAVLGKEA